MSTTSYRRASVVAACAGLAAVLSGGIVILMSRQRGKASRGTIRNVPPSGMHTTEVSTQPAPTQVRVVYASESGNAESLAKGLVRTLRQRGVTAALIDPATWAHLREYVFHSATTTLLPPPPSSPPASGAVMPEAGKTGRAIYIFVLATTGAGEPPANFMTLYHELERAVTRSAAESSPPPSQSVGSALPFAHVYYAVFGLGDSAYKNYCRCAVLTKSFLKKGGATELHRIGFGDASRGNEEEVFEAWQTEVLKRLEAQCGLALVPPNLCGQPPTPQLRLRFLSADEAAALGPHLAPFRATADSATWPTAQHPSPMRLLHRDRLTPDRADDGSAVYRITFETSCAYQGGDHLGIYATNPAAVVARAAGLLGLSATQLRCPVVLQERRDDAAASTAVTTLPELLATNVLPACVSLAVVLERYVDLCGKPKRATLRVLAMYCTNATERAEFDGLLARKASSAGREDKQGEGDGTGTASPVLRTVLDYLDHFPSCRRIGLGHLLEILPRLRPRYYSIASDALVQPHQVDVLVRGVVDGLASSFLCRRLAADGREVVYGFVRSSSFHLPMQRPGRPLLLIGPGTGIAGIVGLCYRRELLLRHRPGLGWGPCVCFFGARSRSEEYFVADELERWALTPAELAAWDRSHPTARVAEAARRVANTELLPCPVIGLLDCAFSREAVTQGPRYVTHLIEKHADYLYTLLTSDTDGGAMVFVSGDASRMAKDVDRALAAVLQEKGKMSRLAAVEFLQRMEHEKRYLKDVY